MTNLEKYEKVNKADSLTELAEIIESFADQDGMIQGRTNRFSAERMAWNCKNFSSFQPNVLTREFGIRQQEMYLVYYGKQ